jgi:hypothetical protein
MSLEAWATDPWFGVTYLPIADRTVSRQAIRSTRHVGGSGSLADRGRIPEHASQNVRAQP